MSIRPEIVAASLVRPATCVEPGLMRQIRPCSEPSDTRIVNQVDKKCLPPIKFTLSANNAIIVENFNLVYVLHVDCTYLHVDASANPRLLSFLDFALWLTMRVSFACQEAIH